MASNLESLDQFLQVMNTQNLTKVEFDENFEKIMDLVEKILQKQEDFNTEIDQKVDRVLQDLTGKTDLSLGEVQRQFKDVDALDKKIESRLSTVKSGRDGRDGTDGVKGETGERGPQGFANSGQDLLEKLKTVDIPISLIAGLEDRLKEIVKKAATRGGIMAGPNANAVLSEDISSQCDGERKIFNVPRHRSTLLLISSQFPFIARPTTDFTTANLQLTLTDEMPAFERGQSLILLYVK